MPLALRWKLVSIYPRSAPAIKKLSKRRSLPIEGPSKRKLVKNGYDKRIERRGEKRKGKVEVAVSFSLDLNFINLYN